MKDYIWVVEYKIGDDCADSKWQFFGMFFSRKDARDEIADAKSWGQDQDSFRTLKYYRGEVVR